MFPTAVKYTFYFIVPNNDGNFVRYVAERRSDRMFVNYLPTLYGMKQCLMMLNAHATHID